MLTLRRILFFSLLSLLTAGCVKENRDNCRGLKLQFTYTYNNQDQNLLLEEVGSIRIYLFAQNTGILVDIIEVGAQDIARGYVYADILDGVYTAVAWGASSENMTQGGYRATTSISQAPPPVAIGSTSLNDFRMMLAYGLLPANPEAEVAPQVKNFDHLFWAIAEDITVAGRGTRTIPFEFQKNTSTLRVIINGIQYLPGRSLAPLNVFTTGKNWAYAYNNIPDVAAAPRMLYEPQSVTVDVNRMEADIRQQRFVIAQSATDPVLLYIRDAQHGVNMLNPINVINAILQSPDYNNQADIDREDLFIIELSIAFDLSITVTVNGWEIIILDPIIRD
ncbi:MAG: FimB/Mfa2 family fimbrial subunit [Rikenellaceae bacterium]|nr:FimB/Mfa2 family fimbrial subunit [Rikenellaceae bacterium]MCL2693040.1 FimB/Mfa2 family fimbrial subunit [Rikenellaceae bacterium]